MAELVRVSPEPPPDEREALLAALAEALADERRGLDAWAAAALHEAASKDADAEIHGGPWAYP